MISLMTLTHQVLEDASVLLASLQELNTMLLTLIVIKVTLFWLNQAFPQKLDIIRNLLANTDVEFLDVNL